MADPATTQTQDPTEELRRLGSSIRRHSQALSRDLAQMRDLLAEFGIELTIAPHGEYDPAKDQTQ